MQSWYHYIQVSSVFKFLLNGERIRLSRKSERYQSMFYSVQAPYRVRSTLILLTTGLVTRRYVPLKMTALSMGAFGAYKHAYSKYLQEREAAIARNQPPETVWVTKRYVPTDLRSTAPVPRHKLLAPKELPSAEQHWIPVTDPPLRTFDRGPGNAVFKSHPSTRCEEYSTLRQMLPSRGYLVRFQPQNWGTGSELPVAYADNTPKRFPIINSPMGR